MAFSQAIKPSGSAVRLLLSTHLPGSPDFVNSLMSDKGHGIPHGRKVLSISKELRKIGDVHLSAPENRSLAWAATLHDIADVQSNEEYRAVFRDCPISEQSVAPMVENMPDNIRDAAFDQTRAFLKALSTNGLIRPFHGITASVFAFSALQSIMDIPSARLSAQAILLHSLRGAEEWPKDPVIRLLKDADKISVLNVNRLLTINKERGRAFFDPDIPSSLRIEITEGHLMPEEQEANTTGLKLDTFQFAAARCLMVDANPFFYCLPEVSGRYLKAHDMFGRFLAEIISTGQKENTDPKMQEAMLKTLIDMFEEAGKLPQYQGIRDSLSQGKQAVDKVNLSHSPIILSLE